MNPVLLKPGSDLRSHVVVMGRPAGHLDAGEYAGDAGGARRERRTRPSTTWRAASTSWSARAPAARPRSTCGRTTSSTWGWPATPRCRRCWSGTSTGAGCSPRMHGTLALLEEADQALVGGLVVNKFRGDAGLLRARAGRRRDGDRPAGARRAAVAAGAVAGLRGLAVGARPAGRADRAGRRLRVAVVRLPRISNFTDVDALCLEPGLEVALRRRPPGAGRRRRGRAARHPGDDRRPGAGCASTGSPTRCGATPQAGGAVLGICGGFQMLGREIADPRRRRGPGRDAVAGLGLLDAATTFGARQGARHPGRDRAGRAGDRLRDPPRPGRRSTPARSSRGAAGPARCSGRCGTAAWRATRSAAPGCALAAASPAADGFEAGTASFAAAREAGSTRSPTPLEEHLDLDAVLRLVEHGAPAGLPPVRGGLVG